MAYRFRSFLSIVAAVHNDRICRQQATEMVVSMASFPATLVKPRKSTLIEQLQGYICQHNRFTVK